MSKTPKIASTFAILDVTKGRKKLAKVVPGHVVPVVIRGFIVRQHGNDDGESIEFSVDVKALEVGEPIF